MNKSNDKKVRNCIVSGKYYPDEITQLNNIIKHSIISIKEKKINDPFAIITAYEDYKTTSSVYGSAYSYLLKSNYDTIIIISPVHKIAFPGIALTNFESFSTPYGELSIDQESNKFLNNFNKEYIVFDQKYHQKEYAAEVQLPYIYYIFKNKVKILPIIIGENNTKFTILLSNALFDLLKNKKKRFLIVVSTNLSRQLKYEISVEMDKKFLDLLEFKNPDYLSEQLAMNQVQAEGGGGVITLLRLLELLKINNIQIIKYLNTGDQNKDKFKVDGYFSAVVW